MDTLTTVNSIIRRTKRAEMLWDAGYNYSFHAKFQEYEYRLIQDEYRRQRLYVYMGTHEEDYFVVIDPHDNGPVAKLYFLVNMINNLKPN